MSVRFKDKNGNIFLIGGSDVDVTKWDGEATPKTFIQSQVSQSVAAGATVTLYTCPSTVKRARAYVNCYAQNGTTSNIKRIAIKVNDVQIAILGQDSAYSSYSGSTFFYDLMPDDILTATATNVAMFCLTTIMEFN